MSETETTGTAFTSIPVIDIAPLFSDDAAAKRKVAAEMADAAGNVGFLYVKGHGIPRETIATLETRAAEFFALPEEKKMERYIGKSRAHLVTQTMRTFTYLKKLVAAGELELPEREEQAEAFGRREKEVA